jgi:hypothetical protein
MNENEERNQYYKFPWWIIVILIGSLLLNVVTYYRVGSLEAEIWNIRNNVDIINSTMRNTISSNIYQINEAMKREASIVTEFKYELGEYKDKRIDLLLNVKPKTYTEGDRLYFSYKIGNEKPTLIEAQSIDNINFEAKINMPVLDNIDLDLVIDSGTKRNTEKLESIYKPAERFTSRLSAHSLGGSLTYDKTKKALMISYGFELVDMGGDIVDYLLKDVELSILVNGRNIDTEPILKSDNINYTIQLINYELPCNIGDVVDIYITAKDSKGFEYVTLAESWKLGQDGSIEQGHKMEEMGQVQIR